LVGKEQGRKIIWTAKETLFMQPFQLILTTYKFRLGDADVGVDLALFRRIWQREASEVLGPRVRLLLIDGHDSPQVSTQAVVSSLSIGSTGGDKGSTLSSCSSWRRSATSAASKNPAEASV
jgi:hypothetical protein